MLHVRFDHVAQKRHVIERGIQINLDIGKKMTKPFRIGSHFLRVRCKPLTQRLTHKIQRQVDAVFMRKGQIVSSFIQADTQAQKTI